MQIKLKKKFDEKIIKITDKQANMIEFTLWIIIFIYLIFVAIVVAGG